MSSQKTPLSASKRAVPIQIKVLHLSDRDNLPYSAVEPRWSFTMTLMPLTKIRELCIHAVGQVHRTFNAAVVEAASLEARDRDGHVFHGMETISEEILNGETIYLVEGEGTGTGTGKGKDNRGRLLSLRTEAEQAYRTPSASSRSSSQSRKRAKSQPRMTPSQRALAIARAGLTPRSEPVTARRRSTSAASSRSPASPRAGPSAAEKGGSEGRDDASGAVGDAPTAPKQDTSVALSQRSSPSPVVSPRLQDSQRVVPDSQNSPPVSPTRTPSAHRTKLPSAAKSRSIASKPSTVQPRSAPPYNPPNPDKLQNIPSSTKTFASKPDPYDIRTVLSDDENHSPKRPGIIMSTPARKLGSADKRRVPASQPPLRHLQQNIISPSRASKSAMADRNSAARNMDFINPNTPTRKTSAPSRAKVSSPSVALPSSPTNNVAAVIARGRNKFKRRPVPECVVIDDLDDRIDEELFRDSPGMSPLTPEALLPWSQPPLRMTQDQSLGIRPVTRRVSMSGVLDGAVKKEVIKVEDNTFDSKTDVRRLIDAAKETLAAAEESRRSMARAYSSCPNSSFHLESPFQSPPKTMPSTPAAKKPSEQTMPEQSTVTIVRGVDRKDKGDKVDEGFQIIKEEMSDEDSWKQLPAAAPPSPPSHRNRDDKEKGVGVIGLSSDSESSIHAAWLDDDEAEIPVLAEYPVVDEPLPPDRRPRDHERPAPVLPVEATNPLTDPMEPRDNGSPPSAQPDKRKRSISDEPNSEDERERKKAKKIENRRARKALKKARRREQIALMEQEKKRLALEQAHRRALELEMVVSSPSREKEAESRDSEDESDDDSGLKVGIPDEDKSVEDVDVPLYGDDSLPSEEAEDQKLWLHKRDYSSSLESNQDSPEHAAGVGLPESPSPDGAYAQLQQQIAADVSHLESPTSEEAYAQLQQQIATDVAHLESPTSDEANAQLQKQIAADVVHLESPTSEEAYAQLQQISDETKTVENKHRRRVFDDWAALEATLGSGGFGFGYSPLVMHNRVHLAAVHQNLQAAREASQVASPAHDSSSKSPPKPTVEAQETPRSIRCGAPSPKDTPAPPEAASTTGSKKARKRKKCKNQNWSRRERNKKRLQSRARADHNYSKFRDTTLARKTKNH